MSPWAESKALSLLSALLLVFTTLILPGSTRSLKIQVEQCPVPNWHVDAINITYSNDTYIPGTASFTLSNTVTNKTEALSCPLTFNSLCQILGTPNDETLQVVMQVNIDAAYITLNQSWTCHDQLNQSTTSTFVIGTGTVNIECPVYAEDMTCFGPADGTGLINGTLVVESEDK